MKTSFIKEEMRTAFINGSLKSCSFDVWFDLEYPADPTDDQILEHYGWECVCESPYELQHSDGSFASGQAAHTLMYSLRKDYKDEMEEN